MGNKSVQDAKIINAWIAPIYKNRGKNTSSDKPLQIHCHIYVTKKKRIFLGSYIPEQIEINISSLVGMSIRTASLHIKKKKLAYNKMINLLEE